MLFCSFLGKNTISKVVKNVHEGSVFSICVLKEGSIITGGGKDGKIVQFDSNLQPTGVEAQVTAFEIQNLANIFVLDIHTDFCAVFCRNRSQNIWAVFVRCQKAEARNCWSALRRTVY